MKIAVFSDTHGCRKEMLEITGYLTPDAVIHLGDDVSDANALREAYPKLTVIGVAGNSLADMMSGEIRTKYMEFYGFKFMMTHGHDYSVKYGFGRLVEAAQSNCANVVLFGHTHIECDNEIKGVRCINPGSMMLRTGGTHSYAILDVDREKLECRIVRLKNTL